MTFLSGSGFILFFAAVLGGALNSVAGGGSFITFPTLIFTGVPAIQANATSTVALWPGSLASVGAYRKEIAKQNRLLMLVLVGISLIGGILGAVLLLRTPQATFVRLIPYLLLLATLLFAFSPLITARLRKRDSTTEETHISWVRLAGISLLQLVIATYGGYFGGGIGIMILASLGIMGMENIHEMNGLKTVLQSCINGVAVITFIIAGAVFWPQAIVMILGAVVGGFSGASLARRLDQRLIRGFVILVGTIMTIYFFVK
jgi:uncharacterized membrane protein YfcA